MPKEITVPLAHPLDGLKVDSAPHSGPINGATWPGSDNEPIAAEVWPTFADWWDAYGKKIDRAKCERRWNKMGQADKEEAMRHTERYVEVTPDIQYRRHPYTYLHNENWKDEQLITSRVGRIGAQGGADAAFADKMASAAAGLLGGQ